MNQVKKYSLRLAVFAGLLAGHSVVPAFEFEPGVGAGLLYTDNARLTPSDEEGDLIFTGYLGAAITEEDGPLRVRVLADVIHLHYLDNTFSSKTYPGLNAIVEWEQVKERLDWKVRDFFTQRRIDAVGGITPDNIQNTNTFTFGADITLPVTGRHTVSITPEFRDFTFEEFGSDNRQYLLAANWAYQMYRTLGVGLTGKITDVNIDSDDIDTDFTRTKFHFNIWGTGARTSYGASIGATHVDRDSASSRDGVTGNLALQYQFTGHSSARLYVASNITDTGTILLNSETDPENGGFSNVQTSDDVLRDSILRLSYFRDDSTFQTLVWGELRELDYELVLNDRDVFDIGAQLDYRVTPVITTSLVGMYSKVDRTDIGVEDDVYSLTGTLAYNLSRKLSASFDIRYQERENDSDALSADEYKEFSSFVRLVYGASREARPDHKKSSKVIRSFGAGVARPYAKGRTKLGQPNSRIRRIFF